MKRQRSKAELLANMRAYNALKKDEQGSRLSGNAVYWRLAVEWCTVLYLEEKFSANELGKLLQYINDHNVTELPEERREEISRLIEDKGVDWRLKNSVQSRKMKNAVDQAVNDLQYHNTKVSVDYSLLVLEYLITQKKYGRKRLDRVVGSVLYLDNVSGTEVVYRMRQELFDKKGIWVELTGEDKAEEAEEVWRI